MLLAVAGCGAGTAASSTSTATRLPTALAGLPVVDLRVGQVTLRAEVADTPAAQEAGLRGRSGVPAGTGMVFRFPTLAQERFTMAGVTYPLVAVFVRSGSVVSVEHMSPCAGTLQQCPVYGPTEAVDSVVEAAPESLPDVAVGDPVS